MVHIIRQSSLEPQVFFGHRMHEAQYGRMKRLTIKARHGLGRRL